MKWWYGIVVAMMICAFCIRIDVYPHEAITWSVWPVAADLYFGEDFPLLNKFGRD
jgi:hypothetical protein